MIGKVKVVTLCSAPGCDRPAVRCERGVWLCGRSHVWRVRFVDEDADTADRLAGRHGEPGDVAWLR